jgi:hypothetical protein
MNIQQLDHFIDRLFHIIDRLFHIIAHDIFLGWRRPSAILEHEASMKRPEPHILPNELYLRAQYPAD